MCWAPGPGAGERPLPKPGTASLRQVNHHLALPQMPQGLHLTLTLLCPQAGPARSALGAWASPHPNAPGQQAAGVLCRHVWKREVEEQGKGEDQVLGSWVQATKSTEEIAAQSGKCEGSSYTVNTIYFGSAYSPAPQRPPGQ